MPSTSRLFHISLITHSRSDPHIDILRLSEVLFIIQQAARQNVLKRLSTLWDSRDCPWVKQSFKEGCVKKSDLSTGSKYLMRQSIFSMQSPENYVI